MELSLSAIISRFAAQRQYSSLISTPIYCLPSFFATTGAVPLPMKGSKIRFPLWDDAKMNLAYSFSGFCVGCSVFSGIDQNGMLMSSQKLEGYVNLKLPSGVSSQSFGFQSTL